MSLIRCEDLTLGYDNRVILKNLDFSVEKGDYLAIVGENGAGKSTLMKTILGLTKPLGGKIIFGDGLNKNSIGYLPQQSVVQRDFPASVWEVVISGCLSRTGLRPFYNAAEKALACDAISKMGLSDLKKRSYRELSGGQQQRVLLARALCATGNVILLDEPVSGLDPKVTAEMYQLVKELNDGGTTVIMISHDVAVAVRYANKILHVAHDTFFGNTADYLSSKTGKRFLAV